MKITRTTIFALFAIAALCAGFITCVDQSVMPVGKEADLLSLSVGNLDIKVIPAPITSSIWDGDSGIYSGDFSSVYFNRESEITNARIRPRLSRDATAEWGIGNLSTRPGEFYNTKVPATFESDEFIYIKVTSGDRATVNYYRFYTKVFSWVNDLASIKIGERDGKLGTPSNSLETLLKAGPNNSMLGSILITIGESGDALVEAATFDPNATVRFGHAKGEASPEFQSTDIRISFDDLDYLYVEVTAENTLDINYYKFRVDVGRMTTIAHLVLKSPAKNFEIFGKGQPNPVYGNATAGEFATAKVDQPAGGFDVEITLDDPQGEYAWQIYTTLPANNQMSGSTVLDKQKKAFNTKDYLLVRVKSKNGNLYNYYKIQVTLLAANIKAHPKSAWYYADYVTDGLYNGGKNQAEPLSIVFADGTNTAGFTYQWYTADSLFGFYGRHGMSLDEKNNISTINGGPDMYYYLTQPGIDQMGVPIKTSGVDTEDPKYMEALAWEIPGATSSSYTPPNNWKNVPIKLPKGSTQNKSFPYNPAKEIYSTGETDDVQTVFPAPAPNNVNFVSGNTSEVRYYWVVVKDTAGLTVTSDRAVILTETNPKMDHYIFELSTLPRKNVTPFKKLRELYKIDLPANYFPEGFDPSKYEMCTAQAQYFLPDGRPWTQNWTHGDMHMGYTEVAKDDPAYENSSYHKNQDQLLTWWHNNLGSNSGAIPLQTPHSAQGGLRFPPDWIGFAPSGDPSRGLPPTINGKLPIGLKPEGFPEGAAQGYFCGFIELMELRFAIAPPK